MLLLVKTRLFSMIKESVERCVSVSEWEKSYESFAHTLFSESEKSERIALHNSLCYAKAELAFCESLNIHKKKINGIVLH